MSPFESNKCAHIQVLSWHFSLKRPIAFSTVIFTSNFCLKNSTVTAHYFFYLLICDLQPLFFPCFLLFFHFHPFLVKICLFLIHSPRSRLEDLILLPRVCFSNGLKKLLKMYLLFANKYRSHWPRGLRHRSAAACLLQLPVLIPPGTWMSVSCDC